MGFLGSLLGKEKEKEYPPLDPTSAAARRLDGFKADIQPFVSKVSDHLEFIPTDKAVYAFIGKPPDAFGIVWWSDGKEHNLKTLMKTKALSQVRVQLLSDALRDSYKHHQGDARFSATVAGKKATITPSENFAADIEKLIHEVE